MSDTLSFILAFYFVAGASVTAGVCIMNIKAGNWHGWGSLGYCLVLLPFWPFYSIGFLKWALNPTKSKCAWCGQISHSDAEVKAHICVCKLHPMRLEIIKAQEDADRLFDQLVYLKDITFEVGWPSDGTKADIDGVLDQHEAAKGISLA